MPSFKRPSPFQFAIALAVMLLGLTVCLWVSGYYLLYERRNLGLDEGYIAAIGQALIHGKWLPYVDGVSQRGPLLYWTAAAVQWLFGESSWLGMRILTTGLLVVAVVASFIAGAAARLPLAGAVGGTLYALFACVVTPRKQGIALNGEPLAATLSLVAVALLSIALHRIRAPRRRSALLVAAGAVTAMAGLSKQTALAFVVPVALWALASGWRPELDGTWRTRLSDVGWLLSGWAGALGLALLPYVIHGEVHTLVYWMFTYNQEVYMLPYQDVSRLDRVQQLVRGQDFVGVGWLAIGVLLVASLGQIASRARSMRPVAWLRSFQDLGLEATAAVAALLATVAAIAPMRFWPHYYLLAAPWFALLVGIRTDRLLRSRGRFGTSAGYLLTAVLFTALVLVSLDGRLAQLRRHYRKAPLGPWYQPEPDPVCSIVQRYSEPGDSMFVWGFRADLHVQCARRPASRFVYSVHLLGVIPPYWGRLEPRAIGEGSRQLAAADLETNRPAVIVEIRKVFDGRSIFEVPELGAIVKRDYCQVAGAKSAGEQAQVYVRRRDSRPHRSDSSEATMRDGAGVDECPPLDRRDRAIRRNPHELRFRRDLKKLKVTEPD